MGKPLLLNYIPNFYICFAWTSVALTLTLILPPKVEISLFRIKSKFFFVVWKLNRCASSHPWRIFIVLAVVRVTQGKKQLKEKNWEIVTPVNLRFSFFISTSKMHFLVVFNIYLRWGYSCPWLSWNLTLVDQASLNLGHLPAAASLMLWFKVWITTSC